MPAVVLHHMKPKLGHTSYRNTGQKPYLSNGIWVDLLDNPTPRFSGPVQLSHMIGVACRDDMAVDMKIFFNVIA